MDEDGIQVYYKGSLEESFANITIKIEKFLFITSLVAVVDGS